MRKAAIAIVLLSLVSLFNAGCVQRLIDFTTISTKNMDWSRASSFTRGKQRTSGEDMVHIIIFVPTGTPSMEQAIDRAIQAVPGAVALVDGVVLSKFWWIPYIYGRSRFVIEGTPLIDPELARSETHGEYVVTTLDKQGNVEETRNVSKAEYEAIRREHLPEDHERRPR